MKAWIQQRWPYLLAGMAALVLVLLFLSKRRSGSGGVSSIVFPGQQANGTAESGQLSTSGVLAPAALGTPTLADWIGYLQSGQAGAPSLGFSLKQGVPGASDYEIGTNPLGPPGNFGIWAYVNNEWHQLPGYAAQIHVVNGVPVVVNTAGQIFGWNSDISNWQRLPGSAYVPPPPGQTQLPGSPVPPMHAPLIGESAEGDQSSIADSPGGYGGQVLSGQNRKMLQSITRNFYPKRDYDLSHLAKTLETALHRTNPGTESELLALAQLQKNRINQMETGPAGLPRKRLIWPA